jgi:hypothetical protein
MAIDIYGIHFRQMKNVRKERPTAVVAPPTEDRGAVQSDCAAWAIRHADVTGSATVDFVEVEVGS